MLIKQNSDKSIKDFKEVYQRYAQLMLGVCMRYILDKDEAQDVMHDGFLKVFDNLNKLNQINSIEGWIKRIMINTSIDYYHKKKKRQIIELTEEHPITNENNYQTNTVGHSKPNLSQVLDANFTKEEIIGCLNQINEPYSIIFKLHVIEKYPHKEIAKLLKISENVSRTRLSRARNVLKQKLHEMSQKKIMNEE